MPRPGAKPRKRWVPSGSKTRSERSKLLITLKWLQTLEIFASLIFAILGICLIARGDISAFSLSAAIVGPLLFGGGLFVMIRTGLYRERDFFDDIQSLFFHLHWDLLLLRRDTAHPESPPSRQSNMRR